MAKEDSKSKSKPREGNPRAEQLEEQARKMATKFDWFGASREKNQEEAAELYVKAAAQWKLSKHFMKAGECYERAAECNMAADNQIEANTNWKEAGKAFRHVDAQLAIRAYKHAIQHYLNTDKFNQAARLYEEIAKMLQEDDAFEEAISQYEECADLFETDNDVTNANKRWLIVAHLSAKLKRYGRAVELFEKVANHNMDNNLLRWNVKTLLFKAFICQLNDCAERDDPKKWAQIPNILERYKAMSDLFTSARECKLCESIATAVPGHDLDSFKEACVKFDTIQKFEPWMVEQLLTLEHYIVEKRHEAPDFMDAGPDLGSRATAEEPPSYAAAAPDQAPPDLTDAPDLL